MVTNDLGWSNAVLLLSFTVVCSCSFCIIIWRFSV